ncbi:hypothetical protein [Nocardia farcinica]|uniref:hypothetical protein n=1 Tax=Nocardia farcinica TaxID=37329 RepID=UPI0018955F75|nr:hypothetical protein [Nocardia farcinica]MBF6577251.1 hypothetical protein [Nocardia farcinica]
MSNSNGYRSRAFELWTDERNAELVELLRAGLPEDLVAERVGRSVGALRAQCREMIPPRERMPREKVVPELADLVADPGFDWRERLRELARRARTLYWDSSMCERLRDGWEQARALEELCEELGASEVEIARQLMRLGVPRPPPRSPNASAAIPAAPWPGGSGSRPTGPRPRCGC